MADNTVLDPGTGGDTIRDKDRAGVKTPIVALDLNPAGSETLMAGSMPVTGTVTANAGTGTLAVSAASLPLPTGAATSAKQPALGTAGTASTDVLTVQGIASMTALKTDGSATTQPVSAAALPLPTGASTAAKQPALGTAGTPSADVLTVQGVTSMTALKVDGSGVTQPVSGTVTANAGTGTMSVNHAQVAGTTADVNTGNASAGTQRVVLASNQPVVPVSDNAGSLTVDAPVGTPVFATITPSTTGGWSKSKYAAQTTTVQTPKGTAGTFGGYYVYNPNASVAYVQVFDVATATTVTLGTTSPDLIFGIPAGSGANLEIANGVNMVNGIKLACTTTATGSTAPTTGLDLTVFYK